jgi:hypothetical protein
MHYCRWTAHGDPTAKPPRKARRFYQEVVLTDTRGPNDPCLIWPFATDRRGYGQIRIDDRLRTVSNLICRQVHGEPPSPDHESAHSCDRGQEGCVTLSHVSWKTHAENMAEMAERGRSNRGERSPTAKLTEADVREIRALRGKMKGYKIAEKFGMDGSHISAIQRRKVWKHVA